MISGVLPMAGTTPWRPGEKYKLIWNTGQEAKTKLDIFIYYFIAKPSRWIKLCYFSGKVPTARSAPYYRGAKSWSKMDRGDPGARGAMGI